jgi:excisionase family DNA binding protein
MSVSVVGDRVVCPQCGCAAKLLRITRAASLVDVSRRTIYGYIEDGSVYAVKVAGKTLRVCSNCLLDRGSKVDLISQTGHLQ